jgi:hypothetical protein
VHYLPNTKQKLFEILPIFFSKQNIKTIFLLI